MNKPFATSVLAFAALLACADARASSDEPTSQNWYGDGQPVPDGVKLSLEVDRPEYFLGENVLVHVVIENQGKDPFTLSHGGDYRGSGRSERFKVSATDEKGGAAEDPMPDRPNFGGMMGTTTLKPGERCVESIPFMRYCLIPKAGRYTVRISHDFGWKVDAKHKHPVAEGVVVFREPDAKQADQVVEKMVKMGEPRGEVFGTKTSDYRDFGCLRLPVYLPALARLMKDGNERGMEGVAGIETPEATRLLMAVAGDEKSPLALKAMSELVSWRVPASDRLAWSAREHKRIVARSWKPEFALEVRVLAKRYLDSVSHERVEWGARVYHRIGVKEDAPTVLASWERLMTGVPSVRPESDAYTIGYPAPGELFFYTMDALCERGYAWDDAPGRAGAVLYFHRLAGKPGPRPAQWRARWGAAMGDVRYTLREQALRSTPDPMPADCKGEVMKSLADPDPGVRVAACGVAWSSGDKEFIKPLLGILAVEKNQTLLASAQAAAEKLGAGFSLHELWLKRLETDPELYSIALDDLVKVLADLPTNCEHGGGSVQPAERDEIIRQWRAFFAKHGEEIKAGKKFSIHDPEVSPKLFGNAKWWRLDDDTRWPKQNDSR